MSTSPKFCEHTGWGRDHRGKVASKIHEYTDGQGSPVYKVGSLVMAGQCVPKSLLLDAADDIKSTGGRGSSGLSRMLRGWARQSRATLDGRARRRRR